MFYKERGDDSVKGYLLMKKSFYQFREYLKVNEDKIVAGIIKTIVDHDPETYSGELMQKQLNVFSEQIQQFVQLLGKNAAGESLEEEVVDWGEKVSEAKVRLGLTLNQSIENFNMIRKASWKVLQEFIEDYSIQQAGIIFDLGQLINSFIDRVILTFSKSYTSLANNRLRAQQEVIDDLGTPVISIVDGVAVLPIIGDIDTRRARVLLEHVLKETNRQEIDCLIMDFSGVFIVDTMVAQELFKIIDSLKLTGVEVNITGMRPELAQSVVTLGINFNGVKMYNNLGQALRAFGIVRK